MRIAIYPGTFDPITFGHLDIIKRASELFDHLIIAAAKDNYKNPLFTPDERVKLIEEETQFLNKNNNISVEKFEGLLVEYASKRNSITEQMRGAADQLQFELAGRLRDELKELKRELRGMDEAGT